MPAPQPLPENLVLPQAEALIRATGADIRIGGNRVKGLGEIGVSGTNVAIANALYHATGKRLRKAPIRLEDFLG